MELHINNISKTYSNGVQALKDLTLTLPTECMVVLHIIQTSMSNRDGIAELIHNHQELTKPIKR